MQEGASSEGTPRSGRQGGSSSFPFASSPPSECPLSPSRMQSPWETSHLALHVAEAVYKIQSSFCASVVALGHVPCEESYILPQRSWLWAGCFPSVETEEQVCGGRLGSQSSRWSGTQNVTGFYFLYSMHSIPVSTLSSPSFQGVV